jgi:hypothetical protein
MGVKLGPSHERNSVDFECLRIVLKEIFEPKKEEIMGGRRKLHNEELHNLYSS